MAIFSQEPWPSSIPLSKGNLEANLKAKSLKGIQPRHNLEETQAVAFPGIYNCFPQQISSQHEFSTTTSLFNVSLEHMPLTTHTEGKLICTGMVFQDSAFWSLPNKAESKEHIIFLNIWIIPWWCLLWIMAFRDLPGALFLTLEESSYPQQRCSTCVGLMDGHALARVKTLRKKKQKIP